MANNLPNRGLSPLQPSAGPARNPSEIAALLAFAA